MFKTSQPGACDCVVSVRTAKLGLLFCVQLKAGQTARDPAAPAALEVQRSSTPGWKQRLQTRARVLF